MSWRVRRDGGSFHRNKLSFPAVMGIWPHLKPLCMCPLSFSLYLWTEHLLNLFPLSSITQTSADSNQQKNFCKLKAQQNRNNLPALIDRKRFECKHVYWFEFKMSQLCGGSFNLVKGTAIHHIFYCSPEGRIDRVHQSYENTQTKGVLV